MTQSELSRAESNRPEVNFLVQHLRDRFAAGKMATYASIMSDCSIDAQRKRHFLYDAIAILGRDYGYVISCVRGIGYQKVSEETASTQVTRKRFEKARSNCNKWGEELQYAVKDRVVTQEDCIALTQHAMQAEVLRQHEAVPAAIESSAITLAQTLDSAASIFEILRRQV